MALDAFLAGNDLLFLNQFIESEDPDAYTTITRTLDFFTQKYSEDPLFAERVDQSVERILALKFKLYDDFELDQVVNRPDFNKLGFSTQITYDVAQQGVTIISPSLEEFDSVLPGIPGRNEFVVFITDDTYVQQCAECPQQPVLAIDALSKAVMDLYGPQSGGLVSQYYLRSFSFSQLIDLLNEEGDNFSFLNDIDRSSWIVFVMQDITEDRPASIALKRFLSERPDLISGKRILVFAANGPNYLDSTDISKVNAYFGLFSTIPPYIDIAARVLFKEIARPSGSLPISVPGVGYDLILATSPDPSQSINLMLDIPEWTLLEDISPSENLPIPGYRVGDAIPLITNKILDTNNNPVPNNTPVQVIVTINGEPAPGIATTTSDGIFQTEYIVNQSGTISVQVQSGLAFSNILIFEIPEPEITPQPSPTITPTDTPTLEPTPTTIPPTPTPTQTPIVEGSDMRLDDWFGAVAVAIFVGWGASRTGTLLGKVRWGIRWGFAGFIGGLISYTYVVLKLPGSDVILSISETWALVAAAFLGAVAGWLIALSLMVITNGRNPMKA
jgi:beta-N-acetylhexosaminidase